MLLYLYELGHLIFAILVLLPFQILELSRRRSSLKEAGERFGLTTPEKKKTIRVWVHAVSIGEMLAAKPLLSRMNELQPDLEFILTTGTRDGKKIAFGLQQHLPNIVHIQYIPWDCRLWLEPWIRRAEIDALAILETEIWPALYACCGRLQIPLCIVNGRIYPRDEKRYRILSGFLRKTLANVAWFGVQSLEEVERYIAIGSDEKRITVEGNLKFDQRSEILQLPESLQGRWAENSEFVLTAGSTHAPEEVILLNTLLELRGGHPETSLKLVLAPRHVDRGTSLASEVKKRGLSVVLFSEVTGSNDRWDVMILDEIGWLPTFFVHSDLGFIGGTLARIGGHNPVEAALSRCPILIGPFTENFAAIVEAFKNSQALHQVQTGDELTEAISFLLANEVERQQLADRALKVVEGQSGASQAYANKLLSILTMSRTRPNPITAPDQQA